MAGEAANPAPGVAVNAALEFLTETDDWATNERTRKTVLRLYQETVGKSPPAAVTNFGWVRLRVAYEITRCRAENEGLTLSAKWQERYEAVMAWDHAKYVELTGQTKVGPPGEDTQMRTVKEVKAKAARKPKAAGEKKEGPVRKFLGKVFGLSAAKTWERLFQEEAKLIASGKQPRTDEQLKEFMAAEFENPTANMLAVAKHRGLYNKGKLACQQGNVPPAAEQVPVPGKESKPEKMAAPKKTATSAKVARKPIRVKKAAKK